MVEEVAWAEGHDEVLCYLQLLIDAIILARVPFREKFANRVLRHCYSSPSCTARSSILMNVYHCAEEGGGSKQCMYQEHQGYVIFFSLVPRPKISAGSECITREVQRGPRKVCA